VSGPRLAGRRLLITGAAQGIGADVARRCVAEGASVALVDRDPAVERLAEQLGGRAFVADVTSAAAAASTVAEAIRQLGGLDGLANVAGVHRDGDVVDTSDESWNLVLGVNLTAPFLWARAALPAMLEAGEGAIVNIGSIASSHALPRSAAYVASKTGLIGLTRSLAVDFGRRGVRSNAILPGSIETEFLASYIERNPERGEELMDRNFAGRFGTPDEVAACCAYLLSDEARFINGASIAIDGGRTAAT
jgi:2-keto-3-deoxy-L-fuconate dehydrogenase